MRGRVVQPRHEQRRPFEIFINSKNLDHFQWIVALTRILSAVFRKGGDVTFLVDEMKAVFDPRGGYWQSGGKFMPSIIAELGYSFTGYVFVSVIGNLVGAFASLFAGLADRWGRANLVVYGLLATEWLLLDQ